MSRYPSRSVRLWQLALVIVAVGLFATPASSHEMWIQVEKSVVKPGAEVSLALYVGQQFKGDELSYNPRHFQHFQVSTSVGQTSIPGHYGNLPAGRVGSVAEGLNIVTYISQPQELNFQNANKWQRYLEYEGLNDTARFYRQNGFPSEGILEHYQRCARALIWGRPSSGTSLIDTAKQDRPIGLPLELYLLSNPFNTALDHLNLKLLYRSTPLADTQVRVFFRPAAPDQPVTDHIARTTPDGTVALPHFGPGDYLFNAVHLIPTPPEHPAKWQSYWASLTFKLE